MCPHRAIVFGNGLGMALDPAFFRLSSAMDFVWNDPNCLGDDPKRLIQDCLYAQGAGDQPTGEDDLDVMHLAVNACEFLHNLAGDDEGWLTPNGRAFPGASRNYLTKVAWYFHHHHHALPDEFLTPLFNFIFETRSHVATLNYDNLMYQKMIEAQILRGYYGYLVDGFWGNGFEEDHLRRLYDNDFGYYMHLHGSPLYIDRNGAIIKQLQGEAQEIPTKHLVLTHVRHKRTVIDASPVLSTYWQFFSLALQESPIIYIFGYAGLDTHLNSLIQGQAADKIIHIVEWSGAGDVRTRQFFWESKFGMEYGSREVILTPLDNILTFTEWE